MTPEQVPEISYPRIAAMVADDLEGKGTVTWIVGQQHLFVDTMRVVAMFINEGFIEIYSMTNDRRNGMRDLIPVHRARIIRETMPIDVYGAELAHAESGYPDDDDDDDPEIEDDEPEVSATEPAPPVPANGQVSP